MNFDILCRWIKRAENMFEVECANARVGILK